MVSSIKERNHSWYALERIFNASLTHVGGRYPEKKVLQGMKIDRGAIAQEIGATVEEVDHWIKEREMEIN